MTYIVMNPTWSVPKKIAGLDMLTHIREEPDYLKKMGFKVYRNYDEDSPEIDPSTVDWSKLTLQTMEYRFKQASGPLNALGRIKFIFPNKFDVYLHDTPSRDLFQRTVRDFSSGCIRVEKPLELAAYLMQSNPVWTRPALETVLQRKEEQYIPLSQPIIVHLMYWTAWADNRGRVQFREDLYGRDAPLEAALRTPLEQN
jgi:murein L,D-transpeptidase YcbB/YkuD